MSDANEERLLTDLLREVAVADAAVAAPENLERQTMSRWERSGSDDVRNARTPAAARIKFAFAVAAALLLLIGAPRRTIEVMSTAPQQKMTASTAPEVSSIAQEPASVGPQPAALSVKRSARRPASPKSVNVDFVPLVPMTADELSRSFQIVRVQMPRAALRALAGSMDAGTADDPVQADLLLGEDGMARAIRVSANDSVPWRSQ
jgi:hypothetical protein